MPDSGNWHGPKAAGRFLVAAAQSSSVRPSSLLEILAFAVGAKPALRLVVDTSDAEHLERALTEIGVSYVANSVFLEAAGGTWNNIVTRHTDSAARMIVCASSITSAHCLLDAELNDPALAGRLLGYPDCCTVRFETFAKTGAQWPFALLETVADQHRIDARCNRFSADWGGMGLLGELFPCSLSCSSAAKYADGLRNAALVLGLRRLVQQAEEDALRPVEISKDGQISTECTGTGVRLDFAL